MILAIRSARRSPFSPLAFADASLRMDMTVVQVAVTCNGAALAYAEGAPRTSLEIADIMARKSEPMALNNTTEENRRELIAPTMSETALPRFALRIYMLSGRYCTLVQRPINSISLSLRMCAEMLELDTDEVVNKGVLVMNGSTVTDFLGLSMGKIYDVNLVIGSDS